MMSILDSNEDLGGTTLLLPHVWEGKMGRTVLAFSQVMEAERERFRAFRRALSKGDQEGFDRLFDRAKMHTSAGVYIVPSLADGYHPPVHLPGTREDDRGDSRVA